MRRYRLKSTLLFAVILSSIFLSGCLSEKQVVVVAPKSLPSWYTQPPLSNQSDLYAIGDGKNKQEAITNALAQMASTLSISIASTYSAKTVVKEGRINSSEGIYLNDTQSEIQKIRISNYELLQSDSFGFKKYAVLIKSNKQKLFLGMKQEIEQNFDLIAQNEETLRRANGLKQLSFYKKTKESLSSLGNTLIVMHELNPNFEGSEYLKKMQEINAKYEITLQNISFSIKVDKSAINLKAPLAKGLSEKKIKLEDANSKMHFDVYITSKIEQASSYGFWLARSDVNIVTTDSKGVVVGSNSIHIVGQSSQGFEIAKQNVAVKLRGLIEKEGIGKIMGLDI